MIILWLKKSTVDLFVLDVPGNSKVRNVVLAYNFCIVIIGKCDFLKSYLIFILA